jgi:serine/threonine protein kinase
MEYLEGQPMNRMARKPNIRQHFTQAMWARVAAEALRGLGYAHNLTDYDGTPLEIVHRDISPDNMFLTYDGEVKIVDFGIAKALLNSEKTETGTLKGKVSYMAPEQVRGSVDRRADLFSMGVVLWEFFSGRKLFEGERGSVLFRLMTDPIPSLATELPEIDPRLASIIDRSLQKDPDNRFQTAEEMREELEEFIRTSGDSVPDVQLSRVIKETFAETRGRVQRQVQAAIERATPSRDMMSGTPSGRHSIPEFAAGTPTQDPFAQDLSSPWDVPRPTRSLPRIALQSDTSADLAEVIITHVSHVSEQKMFAPAPEQQEQRKLRLGLFAAVGAAIIAISLAVFFALRTKEPVIVTPSVASPPPSQAPAQPAAAAIEPPAKDPAPAVPAQPPRSVTVRPDEEKVQETAPVAETQKSGDDNAEPRPQTQRPAQRPPQRQQTQRQQTQQHVRQQQQQQQQQQPPKQPPKDVTPPNPVTNPRVKVIEDDAKRKIDAITD